MEITPIWYFIKDAKIKETTKIEPIIIDLQTISLPIFD